MPRNKLSPIDRQVRHQIAQNLKFYSKSMTQRQLADKTDIPASTLSGYFAERSTPNAGALEKIASALGINKSDIDPRYAAVPTNMNQVNDNNYVAIKIPLIGTIAAGTPITAVENVDEYISQAFPKDKVTTGALFALKVKGHSMEPTIPNGAVVLVNEQPTVEDGDIAAVLVNHDSEATIKRVKHLDGIFILIPDNKNYEPFLLTPDNLGRIIGHVIKVEYNL